MTFASTWQDVCLSIGVPLAIALATLISVYAEILRRKANVQDQQARTAVVTARDAAVKAETAVKVASQTNEVINETKEMLNGRMEQLLREATEKAYALGKADGIATVSRAVADSPSVPMSARDVASAIAGASGASLGEK